MAASREDFDKLFANLRAEARDSAVERIGRMEEAVRACGSGERPPGDALVELRRESHNIKGMGATFGYPILSHIAHRLETYLAESAGLDAPQRESTLVYLDRMAAILDRADQPDEAETAEIVRSLPTRNSFSVADVEIHDVEVMIVTPTRTLSRYVANQLAACGFRTLVFHDPIEALAGALRVPPDFVMASVHLDGIGGLDLVRAIRAVDKTSALPAALLTSMEREHAQFRTLPDRVAVVRTGPAFPDDFATAVTRFAIG